MQPKTIWILGIITAIICLGLFTASLFFTQQLVTHNNYDQATGINLDDMEYGFDNITYGLMCFGALFEVYTGFSCTDFLKANIVDENNPSVINHINWQKDINYTEAQAENFCKFFTNPKICNYQ